MGFSTTNRNNVRPIQPKRRLVPPPPIRRNIPQPQMSRPIQPVRPPTGLPQQLNAPTGLPNINQPPLGLPNIYQQPTGLPPTQMQMPTPPAVPVEQSSSLFAPPLQQTQPAIDPVFQQPQQIQQPTIDPVFQQPQMQQPVAPQQMQEQTQPMTKPDIYGGLTPGQALGGEFTMQQPDKNQYVSIDGGRPANPMSQIPMMGKGQYDAMQQPVAGPIDPSFIKMGFNPVQDENGRWIT